MTKHASCRFAVLAAVTAILLLCGLSPVFAQCTNSAAVADGANTPGDYGTVTSAYAGLRLDPGKHVTVSICGTTTCLTNNGSNSYFVPSRTNAEWNSFLGAAGGLGVTSASGACALPTCAATMESWTVGGNTCSGTTGGGVASGATTSVTNTANNVTGSASYTCTSGVWSGPTGASCSGAITCAGGTIMAWGPFVDGSACIGWTPSANTPAGETVAVSAAMAIKPGTAIYQCQSNGQWNYTPLSSSCGSGANCPAGQSVGWNDPSNFFFCYGTVGSGNNGSSTTINGSDAYGHSGHASYVCNSGYWTQIGGSTCAPPAPSNCGAQSATWGSGCSGSLVSTSPSGSYTVTNSASGYTGSASYSCSSTGSWSYSTGSCNVSITQCNGQTVNWGSGCSGTLAAGGLNTTGTVTNTASGYSGSENFTCNSSGTWSAPSNQTCALNALPNCTAQTLHWTAGGNACAGPAPSTNSGVSTVVTNTSSGVFGSANFPCNSGVWGTPSGTPTCLACPAWHY